MDPVLRCLADDVFTFLTIVVTLLAGVTCFTVGTVRFTAGSTFLTCAATLRTSCVMAGLSDVARSGAVLETFLVVVWLGLAGTDTVRVEGVSFFCLVRLIS